MGMTVAMSFCFGACSCSSVFVVFIMKVSRTANTTFEVEMARLARHRCMRSISSSRAAAWEKFHAVRKQKRRYLVEAAALFEPSQRMLPIEHPTVNEGAIVRLDEFAVAVDVTVEPHTILLHQPLAKKIQFERHDIHRRDQIEQIPEKNITMIINAPSSVPSAPCSADGSADSSVDLSGVNASSQPLHTSTTLPMLR